MRRFLAVFLAIMIVVVNSASVAVPTMNKTESVYVNLDYYGDVNQIHVANDCTLTGQSEITDFGVYESVTNLTNRTEVKNDDGKLVWDVSGLDRFAYNGKVSNDNAKNIPWTFDVSYKLNGVETRAEELLGKAGLVEIIVDITANKDAKEYYRNNYMLEVTGSYDLNKYLSVEADEAMFVTTGRTKTLMYIVLPGQSTTLHLRIGSNDFEMEGLTFAMVPIEGKILEKLGDIVDDKKSMEDAMDVLNSSADIILDSMSEMQSSLNDISSGISDVQSGTLGLHDLSGKRDEDIEKLEDSLEDMQEVVEDMQGDLDNAIDGAKNLTDMLSELQDEFKAMDKSMVKVQDDLNDIQDAIEDLPDNFEDISKTVDITASLVGNFRGLLKSELAGKDIDVDGLEASLNSIATSAVTICTIQGVDLTGNVPPTEPVGMSAYTIVKELNSVNDTLQDVKEIMSDTTNVSSGMLNNLSKLQSKLGIIADMIDEDDGEIIIDAVDNVDELVARLRDILKTVMKYNEMAIEDKDNLPLALQNMKNLLEELNDANEAIVSLLETTEDALKIVSDKIYEGSDKMMSGIIDATNDLNKITAQSGNIKNSKNTVRDVIKDNWNEIDEKTTIFNIDVNAKPESFLSDENETPNKVQFMLKTQDIKEVKEKEVDLEVKDSSGNIWTRICAILEKMFGWILKLFNR